MLVIRKATYNDLPEMQRMFAIARQYMKEQGNPTQWKDNRPPLFLIEKDLNHDVSYVVIDDTTNEVVGTFSYTIGIEPTYVVIEQGKWLNDKPYGTIHRIASNQKIRGFFKFVLEFVEQFGVDIRIDTHVDNHTMLHCLESNGFKYCGIITIDDGTTRVAYQKIINGR